MPGCRSRSLQISKLRKDLVADLRERAAVQASCYTPVAGIADVTANASCKGVVREGGCLAASGVGSNRVSEFYCCAGVFAEVTNTSSSPFLLADAPAVVPEHLACECQQVVDARDNRRVVPASYGVVDVLEGFRHSVGPNSLDLGRYHRRYCSVSV